ncbi:CCC motif membrane protein [Aquimarina algicola]|uniref:DUF4190 domain-containing protein n=1 Tax=Aquimarina algicola TaxID=2589995 RepID=A0A504J174_9FLAO|nr:CCC motif membrane protein [Aquimarina algicola]TPN82355.1 DUF4190 domain-containing protein [Aquimarina algicola]
MQKQILPNSTLILVFGIISILGCCCYGLLGMIFGIIALIMAKKATELYNENPELYTGYQNVQIGKILAISGVVLSSLYLIYVIFMFATVGFAGYQDMIEEIGRSGGY